MITALSSEATVGLIHISTVYTVPKSKSVDVGNVMWSFTWSKYIDAEPNFFWVVEVAAPPTAVAVRA
jgi:hypothetical protein